MLPWALACAKTTGTRWLSKLCDVLIMKPETRQSASDFWFLLHSPKLRPGSVRLVDLSENPGQVSDEHELVCGIKWKITNSSEAVAGVMKPGTTWWGVLGLLAMLDFKAKLAGVWTDEDECHIALVVKVPCFCLLEFIDYGNTAHHAWILHGPIQPFFCNRNKSQIPCSLFPEVSLMNQQMLYYISLPPFKQGIFALSHFF